MNYNYHSHTFRCGHAKDTEEEYILRAIDCGIQSMGFSDHIPFRFPDGRESRFRVPMDEVQAYFSTLRDLREKYRDQIELKIGFEMEYYPIHFQAMLANARAWGCEYLILGQHFIGNEDPGSLYVAKTSDDPAQLREYVDCVICGMHSGVFSYIAHPDLFNFTGSAADYELEMSRLCAESRRTDIPLEINFLGIRDSRPYPRETFWAIAGQEQCPVTFGFDAHDALNAYDATSLECARKMVNKYNLNYIGRPTLIPLQP